jgi:hypothetical protein
VEGILMGESGGMRKQISDRAALFMLNPGPKKKKINQEGEKTTGATRASRDPTNPDAPNQRR